MIIIVLDFDDTLFPTTEYTNNKTIDTEKTYQTIKKTLDIFKTFSQLIYIITNASEEWVRYCFIDILNKPLDCLEYINIISTIDKGYNYNLENAISTWKKIAFEKVLYEYLQCDIQNVLLFIGDNPYDRDGALHIMKTYPNHIVKSIKYKILPSLDTLVYQHNQTISHLVKILFTEVNLDLQL
jgi:hypothetical protein